MKNILHAIMEPPYGGIDCFGMGSKCINKPHNGRNTIVCSDFNFMIGVNDQFFTRGFVTVDPVFMIVMALLNVF